MAEPTLEQLREQIDGLDEQLQGLLNKRAELAQKVADVKIATDGDAVFYRPEREAQVLRQVKARNTGPLDAETIARLFREIMSACLALEQRLKVAFLGPEGTFTQQAALKHFGHAVETISLAAIDDVFREVASGAAHYGVVPVENSTEGVINHTLDSFMESPLKICGEVDLRIHHHLMLSEHTQLDKITRIYSHQQTLAQCRKWLDTNMPRVERIAVSSNAQAARRLKDEWNAAAIAGDIAADLYDLKILHRNIEDTPDNTTRFIIIGHEEVPPSGEDKSSLLVRMKNRPGALYHVLKPFKDAGVDLTRVESRPSRSGNWSYVFFIDFEGHRDDENVQAVLAALEREALDVRLLGSYPRAVL
ncbi:prephenate dehydratase [Alcanivorax quisquiliarum]|uniref:Bifunctional chorismate mutase/prephenate dehydratase n=1 Tax=Alcanivorax quisquiliarum TaxID=2933565 RepID=A0ABT0EA48_9GAMM|nr:prephenate dehydratase [Alcanivorax quisquiliarum]MCK0538711.1 prephenate dehydratase [Alcanivorax quisquiliarum]